MSTRDTDKTKYESVTNIDVMENLQYTKTSLGMSKKFFEIYNLTCTFYKNRSEFNKKQIKTMETKMDKLFHGIIKSSNTELDDIISLIVSYLNVCYVYILSDQKKEVCLAKDHLLHCLDLIRDKELHPKFISQALMTYYYLGRVYKQQNKAQKSIETYDKAVGLYLAYTEGNDENNSLIDFKSIVVKPSAEIYHQEKLKNMYTDLLTALLEMHTVIKPTNNLSLIRLTHNLLVAEWHRLPKTKTYFKWIDKAITLCDHLLICNRFQEAIYYFSAAMYLKVTYVDNKCDCIRKENVFLKICDWCNQSADAIRLLINYQIKHAIVLLRKSAERLLWLKKDSNSDNLKLKGLIKSNDQFVQKLLSLSGLKDEYSVPRTFEVMKSEYYENYNEAHGTFSRILNLLHGMGLHNKGDIKAYENVALNTCKAYKYMALFERNPTSRMLLQKRCAEFLYEAIAFLHSQYHKVSKYLILQLSIIYLTMIEIKFEHIDPGNSLYTPLSYNTVHVEINKLLEMSLMNLLYYMDN